VIAIAAAVEPAVEQLLGDPVLLLTVDLTGVFVFGLSGGLLAVRKRLDVFGVAVLSIAAALGGGLLRDVLIGAVPPVALTDWRYVGAALAAAALVFVAHRHLERLGPAVRIFDALGLGFFAVAGASKALNEGLPGFAAVGIGVLTAIGGGVVRDLLAGEVPLVLRREIYAVAALVGATVVTVTTVAGEYGPLPAAIAIGVTVAIRLLALRKDWHAPTALEPRARSDATDT
jgi:uncharacterized membrane protein YeiH